MKAKWEAGQLSGEVGVTLSTASQALEVLEVAGEEARSDAAAAAWRLDAVSIGASALAEVLRAARAAAAARDEAMGAARAKWPGTAASSARCSRGVGL